MLRIWLVVTLGLAVRAFAFGLLGPDPRHALVVEPVTIDLNSARLFELQALPGIGRAKAEAIILHRLRHGPFEAVAGLDAVDGFGARAIAALAPFVRVE